MRRPRERPSASSVVATLESFVVLVEEPLGPAAKGPFPCEGVSAPLLPFLVFWDAVATECGDLAAGPPGCGPAAAFAAFAARCFSCNSLLSAFVICFCGCDGEGSFRTPPLEGETEAMAVYQSSSQKSLTVITSSNSVQRSRTRDRVTSIQTRSLVGATSYHLSS